MQHSPRAPLLSLHAAPPPFGPSTPGNNQAGVVESRRDSFQLQLELSVVVILLCACDVPNDDKL